MQTFERDRQRYVARTQREWASEAVERGLQEADAMAVHYQRVMILALRAIHVLAVLMGITFLLYSDLGAPDWMLWMFLLFFVVRAASSPRRPASTTGIASTSTTARSPKACGCSRSGAAQACR